MMTAGVMGLVPRFRYILVTDSLLQFLSEEELNAVMAHEIGHIKYGHMIFYVVFLLGYMALSMGLFDVLFYALATHPGLFTALQSQQDLQRGLFYLVFSLLIIASVIVYFRYVMGFFMRNFERQADLYSAQLIGTPEPTIRSLEKIATATGQSRHHPSWHHFSIAERVEFLWKSWRDPGVRTYHSKRVISSLAVYFLLLIGLGYTVNFGPLKSTLEEIALTRMLEHQSARSSENVDIYRGLAAVYHQQGKFSMAAQAYEDILRLNPNDEVVLNNLAWILATSEDEALVDYPRALELAKRAVAINRSPTFLDTLAEAYYVNGLFDQALDTIEEALAKASANRKYLARQMRRFEKRARGAK
jgi:tetratricopeptide (TPR) repeat protein